MNSASSFFRSCRKQYSRPQMINRTTSRCLQRSRQLSTGRASSAQATDVSGAAISQPNDDLSSSSQRAGASSSNLEAPATRSDTLSPRDREFLQKSIRRVGTVTRTGTMENTVVVSSNRQQFDKFLQKHFTKPLIALVHDPLNTLAEGDVVTYGPFPPDQGVERIKRGKNHIRFVLRDVITPFGMPLEQRTPRVKTSNPANVAGKAGSYGKQRKSAGVRGYATVSPTRLTPYRPSGSEEPDDFPIAPSPSMRLPLPDYHFAEKLGDTKIMYRSPRGPFHTIISLYHQLINSPYFGKLAAVVRQRHIGLYKLREDLVRHQTEYLSKSPTRLRSRDVRDTSGLSRERHEHKLKPQQREQKHGHIEIQSLQSRIGNIIAGLRGIQKELGSLEKQARQKQHHRIPVNSRRLVGTTSKQGARTFQQIPPQTAVRVIATVLRTNAAVLERMETSLCKIGRLRKLEQWYLTEYKVGLGRSLKQAAQDIGMNNNETEKAWIRLAMTEQEREDLDGSGLHIDTLLNLKLIRGHIRAWDVPAGRLVDMLGSLVGTYGIVGTKLQAYVNSFAKHGTAEIEHASLVDMVLAEAANPSRTVVNPDKKTRMKMVKVRRVTADRSDKVRYIGDTRDAEAFRQASVEIPQQEGKRPRRVVLLDEML